MKMRELMLPQAQDVAWKPGSWSVCLPNAQLVTRPPAVESNEAGGGNFFIFQRPFFSALLSVSFDAKERSFDNRSYIHRNFYQPDSRFYMHIILL